MGFTRILRRMGLPGWAFLGAFVSATTIFYAGRALEQMLDPLFEGLGARTKTVCISLLIILIVGSVPVLLAWLWQKSQFNIARMHISGREFRLPERKRGLIILVSNPNSAMQAVRYHFEENGPLERVWLIPSDDRESEKFGQSSIAIAKEIETQCVALAAGVNRKLDVKISSEVSPGDAQDTFDHVNRIFRIAGFTSHEIIADFTGGTKPMTVGMIMACLPRERDLEYVPYNPQMKEMHGPFLIDYQHSAFDLVG
jgi:CRISPR-associated protein (Cas_Cas02710)